MKPRLNIVTLGVSNLQKSKEFYRKALGWEPATGSSDSIIFYYHEGIILALYPFDKLAEDAGMPIEKPTFAGITLAINRKSKEEVEKLFARVIKGGATILIKPRDTFWGGYDAYFADPDGYAWEIAWAPFWNYDEQGSLLI